jgi:hypothetical protein
LTSAYWEAIAQRAIKSVKILVQKCDSFLEEVSRDKFSGLETCLHNRGSEGEEEELALGLLQLGVDPLQAAQHTTGVPVRDQYPISPEIEEKVYIRLRREDESIQPKQIKLWIQGGSGGGRTG